MDKKVKCDACGNIIKGIGFTDPIGNPSLYELKTNVYSGLVCSKCNNQILDEVNMLLTECGEKCDIESIGIDVNLLDRMINRFHKLRIKRRIAKM